LSKTRQLRMVGILLSWGRNLVILLSWGILGSDQANWGILGSDQANPLKIKRYHPGNLGVSWGRTKLTL
jgi:hypothetical protein